VGSGSGRVAVVPLERENQRGSNGVKMAVAVAVLSEIWQSEGKSDNWQWQWQSAVSRCGSGLGGSGRVAVVSFEREKQRGSNGGKMAVAVAVAVLSEIWQWFGWQWQSAVEMGSVWVRKKFKKNSDFYKRCHITLNIPQIPQFFSTNRFKMLPRSQIYQNNHQNRTL
jgi:hypothetical protein